MKVIAVALALSAPLPAAAQGVAAWRAFTAEASQRFGVPVPWIERVMRIESSGQTELAGRPIVSSAGAMGLMQLMPATWAAMRGRAGLGSDPFDPHDNIIAGTLYLRLLYDRFGYPGCFAAYNAGPARYAEYLAGKRSLPGETVRYLASASEAGPSRAPPALAPGVTLFALLQDSPGRVAARSSPVSIFAIPPRD